MITINNGIIHLRNTHISYILEVLDQKYILQRYIGKSLRHYHKSPMTYYKRGYNTEHDVSIENASFDDLPFLYPQLGHGDYRIPAIEVEAHHQRYCELLLKEVHILDEKKTLSGLPSLKSHGRSETLEVVYEDKHIGLEVNQYITIYEDLGVLSFSASFRSCKEDLILYNTQSVSLELPSQDYQVMTMYGLHAKEGNIQLSALNTGIFQIESTRGSSSPQMHPFAALISGSDIYAMHFIYSGNYCCKIQKDSFGKVRMQMGLHPSMNNWHLHKGEEFYTPEVVVNYSSTGLEGMRMNFHELYRHHLLPQSQELPPVLLNTWEAMYYDVSLEKIEEQAKCASELGIELLVLDDGWFRKENNSHNSMGDWKCNTSKLPGGIQKAAELVKSYGLKFGLWFEPEAISKNSDLYIQHPDYALSVDGYEPTLGRHEYLLDLSREDVQNYLIHMLDSYLSTGLIDYIKWDMNRPMSDVCSHISKYSTEVAHRYMLGLYHVLDVITSRYPDVLFEGCSSGGARFDPGILCYMQQNWASDNTDALDRSVIQDSFSLLYPQSVIGAHISAVPNHQTGRITSLETRYDIAKLFNLGYELDLTKCTDDELDDIKKQIQEYKTIRKETLNGELHAIECDENHLGWEVVSLDRKTVYVVIMTRFYNPLTAQKYFELTYLDEDSDYLECHTQEIYGGDELQHMGLCVPLEHGDFKTYTFILKKV